MADRTEGCRVNSNWCKSRLIFRNIRRDSRELVAKDCLELVVEVNSAVLSLKF